MRVNPRILRENVADLYGPSLIETSLPWGFFARKALVLLPSEGGA